MKSWIFISLVACFYVVSAYFFIRFLDNEVSLKYEIFEPTESYYFGTLKTEPEKLEYVREVQEHEEKLFQRRTIYTLAFLLSFLIANGFLVFKKRILNHGI